MKIIINISRLTVLAVLLFAGCKKEGGNPLADINNLTVGAYPTLTETVNLNFDYSQIATSTVGIKVTEYKSGVEASEIQKINVYVVKGSSSDRSVWKLVKTVDYSGDATLISVTGAEMGTALGVDPSTFAPGDYYTFYNQVITKDGRSFDIVNTPLALGSNANYNAAFVWQAYITCPFTGGMEGDYEVLQDDWQDWYPGDIVKVHDGPGANQIDLHDVWPNPAYGDVVNPLVVDVNPANGVATIPLVIFADYGQPTSAQGADANGPGDDVACGYVFSCTGFITLTIRLYYGSTNYGNNKLVLRKIP